jgi:hypothetical protein
MSACGPTNTLYGVDVRGTMQKEFADVPTEPVRVPTMRGGTCACAGAGAGGPKLAFRSIGGRRLCRSRSRSRSRTKRQRGGSGCSGGSPMLRSLGIMAGGKRSASYKCGGSRSAYKPTARNLATLRRFRAGKSIGFTMRSSLKAKGLIPRSNGTYKVSSKYR